MRISEKERLIELYFCLKSVPLELWSSQDYKIVEQALDDKNITFEHCLNFHIFGKLAHFVRDELEFWNYIKANSIPEIGLTPQEAKQLKPNAKDAAKLISKGKMGGASDSLKIFQYYYARAA